MHTPFISKICCYFTKLRRIGVENRSLCMVYLRTKHFPFQFNQPNLLLGSFSFGHCNFYAYIDYVIFAGQTISTIRAAYIHHYSQFTVHLVNRLAVWNSILIDENGYLGFLFYSINYQIIIIKLLIEKWEWPVTIVDWNSKKILYFENDRIGCGAWSMENG